MRREVHTRELQLMDAVRRKYMENQSKVKEVELKRMDDEIQRKVRALQIFRHIMYLYPFCGNSTPIPPTDLARGGGGLYQNTNILSILYSLNIPVHLQF